MTGPAFTGELPVLGAFTPASAVPKNPYVGIRPFLTPDSRFFFGRDEQVAELLRILRATRFLPVVGSSGSGKSSLVLAGLVPQLRGGFLVGTRDRWRIATCRPGDAPMTNLAAELARALGDPDAAAGPDGLEARMRLSLAGAPLDFAGARLEPNASLLLIVDQFEELFAFRGGALDDDASKEARREGARRRAEAADYVDLLMGLAASRDLPVFVVVTMRSDFLGDCDLFLGLPEMMNRARYLVPRLSREQLREAIEGPALMQGAELSSRLVDRLLNELGDRADRLPVLQHALQRTWDAWAAGTHMGPIDLEHFDAAGGLEHALEKDATRAMAGLDATLVERVFRALTDTDARQRRVRRPARMNEIAASAGASRADVQQVVAAFRAEERNFLVVRDDGDPANPRVDISHESLIRQWPRLSAWVDAERRSRDAFLRLVHNGRDHLEGRRELLSERELAARAQAWDEIAGSAAWAERYARQPDDFAVANAFVAKSRAAVAANVEHERSRQRRRRWARRAIIAASVVGTAAAGTCAYVTGQALQEAERELMLSSIRDLSTVDPTIAAALVAELPVEEENDARFSWPDVDALSTIADADVAEAIVDDVVSVDASDGGSAFALLGRDGTILLWRKAEQTEPERIPSGARHGTYISLDSATSVAVVSDSAEGIHVVSLGGTHASHALTGPAVGSVAPVLSRDGRHVLAPCDSALCLWSTAGGAHREFRTWIPQTCDIVSMDLLSGGERALVACRGGGIGLWTPRANATWWIAREDGIDNLSGARLSRDGSMVVASSYITGVRLWRIGPASRPMTLTGSSHGIAWFAAHFDDANKMVVAVGDSGTRVWDVSAADAPTLIKSYTGHGNTTIGARFTADGAWVATWSLDGTTQLWRARGDSANDEPRVLRANGVATRRAVFTHDGSTIVTVANDTSARIWSMMHDPEPLLWRPGSGGVRRAALSDDETRLAAVTDSATLALTRLRLDTASQTFSVAGRDVASAWVDSLADGVHDAAFDGSLLRVLVGRRGRSEVRVLREEPNGTVVRRATEVPRWTLLTLDGMGSAVGFRAATGIGVWRVGSDAAAKPEQRDSTSAISVYVAPGGRQVVAVPFYAFAPALLWSTSGPVTSRELPTSMAPVVAFSDRGDRLVWSEPDNQLRVYPIGADTVTGAATLRGACCKITALAFNHDGTMVVAGDVEGGVNLWWPGGRAGMLRLPVHADGMSVTSVGFSADGKRVVSAGDDGTVRVATIDPEMLIHRVTSYTKVCVPISVWVDRIRKDSTEARDRLAKCEKKWHPIEPDR